MIILTLHAMNLEMNFVYSCFSFDFHFSFYHRIFAFVRFNLTLLAQMKFQRDVVCK